MIDAKSYQPHMNLFTATVEGVETDMLQIIVWNGMSSTQAQRSTKKFCYQKWDKRMIEQLQILFYNIKARAENKKQYINLKNQKFHANENHWSIV